MSHPLFDLSGRIALVSGAASGLGRAMAMGFAEAGADLMLADINRDGMKSTAEHIERLGRRAAAIVCDVSDPDQIRAMFARLDQEYGRIDVLGNVAGDGVLGRPEDIPLEQLQTVLQNLVIGRFCCCQEAGRRMLAAGKGSIINIGSLASVTALGRGHIAYSMAMGAVAQMTRELSTEWSGRGVRVNAILPAQVTNKSLRERMQADPGLEIFFLRGLPIGRLGVPDDIKGLAIFLACDASAWITGALIPMDGGNLAKNAGGSHPGMPV
jgi:NAD(P)-dependent dehydrogenase (short-subunit alcohol dehydrogenase family)